MTRKDYIVIADAIKESAKDVQHNKDAMIAIEVVAGRIAAVMAADNTNFNPKTFFTACGLYKGN